MINLHSYSMRRTMRKCLLHVELRTAEFLRNRERGDKEGGGGEMASLRIHAIC